jgi:preprotein translocase subunit YajC
VIIGASGGSGFLLVIVIGFLVLYLIVVRPQKRRQNQQQQLLSELRVGDEVLTAGGIYGTISQLEDDLVTVEIAPSTEVRVARRAIAGVTRDPEEEETGESDATEEPEEPQAEDEGTAGDTSNEEIRG